MWAADALFLCGSWASCCYPSLIRHPRSLCSLWNFALKLSVRKLESWTIPQWRQHDRSWSRFGTIPACDRQTVRRSDSDGRSDRIYHG